MSNSLKTVFISRELAPDSVFYNHLTQEGWQVIGISLVELTRQPFSVLPQADWYFFYSRHGVDFFMETVKMQQMFVSSSVRWAAIGAGTAESIQKYTQKIDFVGTGEAESTAAAFLEVAKGQRVLFIQAEQSKQSVEKILEKKLDCSVLVAYKNEPKQSVFIPKTEIVVFTSPINVQVFMQHTQNLICTQKVISIGNATAQMLDSFGVLDYKIAENPNEKALAEAVLEVYSKKK